MQCISCNASLSPAFKHALAENVCPACGGPIMDEESLALIEDISHTISSEATLRDETSYKLATALVAKYNVSIRDGTQPVKQPIKHKVAPPSVAQRVAAQHATKDPNIITAEEVQGISESERDAIMADVVSKRYGMVDGVTGSSVIGEGESELDLSLLQGAAINENDVNPILEQERLLRLQKQQSAMNSGSGSFRRGS